MTMTMINIILLSFVTICTSETIGNLSKLDSATSCTIPSNFPATIPLTQQTFKNWAGQIMVNDLWTAIPKTAEDVVTIANWAALHGYKVRPSGFMHTWAPITVTPDSTCETTKILLVKTTENLVGMEMVAGPSPAVRVQTGATLETLLTFLEENGYGVLASPAPGDLTIGGILAINGHGTAVPAQGEVKPQGFTYGSFSNLVLSFTAVVWNDTSQQYALRTFSRSESEAKAFLTNLGKTFLTEVTLHVGPNYNLRCVSFLEIPATELFAAPSATSSGMRTFESFLDIAGRAEAIWYPFTEKPWLKVWTVSPTKPLFSRAVDSPFNYRFSDNIPETVALGAAEIVSGAWFLAPAFGQVLYDATAAGIVLTNSADIWGPSKNLLLYIKPTTLREIENGYAVITARSNVQNIISSVVSFHENLLQEYRFRGEFPINGPLEIRVTGLDVPEDAGKSLAEAPSLSAIRPIEGHPELNCAVWFDILTFPKTPLVATFMADMESFYLTNVHDGITAIVRPEWSKAWGFTNESGWSNETFLKSALPALFASSSNSDGWNWVRSTFMKYDPANVFTNQFLDKLFN